MKLVNGLYYPDVDEHMIKEYSEGKTQLDTYAKSLEYVKDSRCAVDGGAHIGVWSIAMSFDFDNVLAFEPSPDTFECLTSNVGEFTNIHLYNMALSDRCNKFDLAMDMKWEGNTGGRYLVKGTSISSTYIDLLDLQHVDLLKLDIEGHELFALRGAKETLSRCSPVIICEEKARIMKRQGVEPGQVSAYLGQFGYKRVERCRSDSIYAKE